ncbi:PQQ-dependent sugar dehydrogenase [Opitutus sp. ER46]|uniref:PQQ-dependent sugar dehydrogenase n=1 Tax=Opitutus sp. ER46 TaxID=2161864 RepID=UPI000D307A39|nr:PQQ-dependent sugar dehydrogenase [Opitutus sp. ER46]PTX94203.1 glucose sorbosone dehydrogenase [Opitutus sp. ER46]
MKPAHLTVALLGSLTFVSLGLAQRRDAPSLYAQLCASCHGRALQGSDSAPSMLDDQWRYGPEDAMLARIIRDGTGDAGMPSFKAGLSDAEIRSLVIFIHESRAKAQPARPSVSRNRVIKSSQHSFRVEPVVDGVRTPWSVDWLPDGQMLITEKAGHLRIARDGRLQRNAISGTPEVTANGQGGLLDVAVHPDFARNGWIYLSFSHPTRNASGEAVSMTKIVRGRIRDGAWVDEHPIWAAPLETYLPAGGVHYGCRLAFDGKGYLFFSHGERGRKEHAQDVHRPNGKIHRIHDDGRIPSDNPFAGQAGAIGSIWAYGNRNPQGLDFDPRTGRLWETEHGPRGGDELNLIERGRNYGWPVITYGMNYDGTPITGETAHEGMEQPVIHWTPSIAVCGLDFYTGTRFPRWTGNLFVGSLAAEELRRVVIEDNRVTGQELIVKDLGRIRDVANGPDGYLYIAFNDPDQIARLVPAD